MAAALAVGSMPKPAAADTQSTINTLIGAAAVVGGIILYNNYQHKRQAANTVVGYTANGGTVYGDGRIVMPNGQTIYPNSNGQYPWGQQAYYNPGASNYQYDYNRSGQYDRTHRHGNWQRNANYSQYNSYNYNAGRYNSYNNGNNGHHYGEYRNAQQPRPAHQDRDDRGNHGDHGHHGDHGDHGDHGH